MKQILNSLLICSSFIIAKSFVQNKSCKKRIKNSSWEKFEKVCFLKERKKFDHYFGYSSKEGILSSLSFQTNEGSLNECNNPKSRKKTKRALLLGFLAISTLFLVYSFPFVKTAVAATLSSSTSSSIKPFILDKSSGDKVWLKDDKLILSSILEPEAKLPLHTKLKTALQRGLNLSALIIKKFMFYFVLFGILPKTLFQNKRHFRTLDFLESKEMPVERFTIDQPLKAKVVMKKVINSNSDNIIYHLTINHKKNLKFWEGQSIKIINKENELSKSYLVASSRYGDDKNGKTFSLCIDESKEDLQDILLESQTGDEILITGPYKTNFIFNEEHRNQDFIMISDDGNDIAPIRSYLHRLFIDNTRIKFSYQGRTLLFMKNNELYKKELDAISFEYSDKFQLFDKEKDLEENINELFERVCAGAHVILSCSEDRKRNIIKLFQAQAEKNDLEYDNWTATVSGQFHGV